MKSEPQWHRKGFSLVSTLGCNGKCCNIDNDYTVWDSEWNERTYGFARDAPNVRYAGKFSHNGCTHAGLLFSFLCVVEGPVPALPRLFVQSSSGVDMYWSRNRIGVLGDVYQILETLIDIPKRLRLHVMVESRNHILPGIHSCLLSSSGPIPIACLISLVYVGIAALIFRHYPFSLSSNGSICVGEVRHLIPKAAVNCHPRQA